MNLLAGVLRPDDVRVDVDAATRQAVFDLAALQLEARHGVNRTLATENLLARERLGSTALGHGVAIPHGRIKGLRAPFASVLRLRQPIMFDAPDDEGVILLAVLFVPGLATQHHLDILAEIADLFGDRERREALKRVADARSLYTLMVGPPRPRP